MNTATSGPYEEHLTQKKNENSKLVSCGESGVTKDYSDKRQDKPEGYLL